MNGLNSALYFTGAFLKSNPKILNLFLKFKPESLRIVYYHLVTESKPLYYFDHKTISVDEFETQIKFFKKNYDIISLTEAISIAKSQGSMRQKLVITFDDGFKEIYTNISHVLFKYKVSPTVFLIGNCIDNQDLMWRNKLVLIGKSDKIRLYESIKIVCNEFGLDSIGNENLLRWSFKKFPMKKKDEIVNRLWDLTQGHGLDEFLETFQPYLSTEQIKELYQQGFEFGSHSMSHPDFKKLSYEEFKNELISSKEKIEKITKNVVNTFAYPFGNRAVKDFEVRLLEEKPGYIDVFFGTKNRQKNYDHNMRDWERDNVEFPQEIALSRFLFVSFLRNFYLK